MTEPQGFLGWKGPSKIKAQLLAPHRTCPRMPPCAWGCCPNTLELWQPWCSDHFSEESVQCPVTLWVKRLESEELNQPLWAFPVDLSYSMKAHCLPRVLPAGNGAALLPAVLPARGSAPHWGKAGEAGGASWLRNTVRAGSPGWSCRLSWGGQGPEARGSELALTHPELNLQLHPELPAWINLPMPPQHWHNRHKRQVATQLFSCPDSACGSGRCLPASGAGRSFSCSLNYWKQESDINFSTFWSCLHVCCVIENTPGLIYSHKILGWLLGISWQVSVHKIWGKNKAKSNTGAHQVRQH